MAKRGAKSRRSASASAVDQLQAALTRSLKESVAQAVSSVCESFQEAVEEQASASPSSTDDAGYDQYYQHCRRLVDYILQHMEASEGFGEQMDRIILACHSGATERVLSSVVTKQLWFHRRGDVPPPASEREARSSNKSSSSSGSSNGRSKSAAKKKVKREVATPHAASSTSSSSRMATRASTESPAMHTRSVSGSKRSTRGSAHDPQPVKRPRRAARKVIHDTSEEEEEDEEQEKEVDAEEEEEKPVRKGKKKQQRQEEEEDDDELLSFKDAIGELCYPDRRTPTETKFFKDRLRKSIQFVDALLCKPPQGKVCGRGCRKIRAQMCSSSTPCKNKMCRIWHDVEAHTDRCQNPQCEFKNRILLRETMHKLEMKEQQIVALKVEMKGKKDELKDAADDDKEELENDIASLKHDLEECDSDLGVLKATKKTFWGHLNEIGIELRDDVVDNFPDFATHYEDKKAPRKARKAPTNTHLSPASSRSSRSAARRGNAGPHGGNAEDDDEGDNADAETTNGNIPRRTVRRSAPSGRYDAPPHQDSDEETKGGDHSLYRRADEPPRPAGPPPFRQNPEWDREYAAHASGYSIHPPADDLEAPAVAANIETAKEIEPAGENGLSSEQLADMQQASDEISDIMAGMSSNPPPSEPLNTASASTNPPAAEPLNTAGMNPIPPPPELLNNANPSPVEPLNTTGFTIRGNQPNP